MPNLISLSPVCIEWRRFLSARRWIFYGNSRKSLTGGFTLVELLVTIAVIAILATTGIPVLQELIKNNRMDAQARELVALLTYARSEALRRNGNVGVELVARDGGWSGNVCIDSCATDMLRSISHDRVSLSGDVALIFTNRGYLDAWDTGEVEFSLTHEKCRGSRQRRDVVVERTGQLTITPTQCGEG